MNLITWIGILLASVYYFAFLAASGFKVEPSWMLVSVGVIMVLAGLVLLPALSRLPEPPATRPVQR